MVNYIDSTINKSKVTNREITRSPIAPVKQENNESITTKSSSENTVEKYVIPAAMLGSGAVLMYLGFSGPNYKKLLSQVFDNKLGKMKNISNEFINKARETFAEEYKQFPRYIEEYRSAKTVDISEPAAKIKQSQAVKEVFAILDETISNVQVIKNKRKYPHLSEPDEMRKDLFDFNHSIYQALSNERTKLNRDLLDTSIMPRFRTGKHAELVDKFEIKLCDSKEAIEKEMFDAQNNATDEHLQASAKVIADVITETRKGYLTATREIMEAAFDRIAQMFNLGSDFKPLFRLPKPFKPLSNLSQPELQPQMLSQEAKQLLNNHFLEEALEKTDFSHPKVQNIMELFDRMPDSFDVRQLDLVTDRIRLQQAVIQAEKQSPNPELNAIIQKLEFLSDKLEVVGRHKLTTRINQSFVEYTPQQLHAKLYYVNREARKLGLYSLADLEKYLMEKSKSYPNSKFKILVPEFQADPLKYFM